MTFVRPLVFICFFFLWMLPFLTGCQPAAGISPEQLSTTVPRTKATRVTSITSTPVFEAVATSSAPRSLEPTIFQPTLAADPTVDAADLPEYTLDVSLDYHQRMIAVKQVTSFLVPAADLQAVPFVVYPASIQSAFELKSVLVDSKPPTNIVLEDGVLWVYPEKPLMADEKAHISIEYILRLPFRAAKLGFTYRQMNFGDWYPMLPIYDLENGWMIFPPSQVGENINYPRANIFVVIQVDNIPETFVLAASAPAKTDKNIYSFELLGGRNFTWSASTEYELISQSIGAAEIRSYYFPEHAAEGAAVLDASVKAYEIYTELLGNLNQNFLSVVEADFRDGMEYQSFFFLGKEYYDEYAGSPQSYLFALSAHETAHQWFYAEIANNQAEEPWLDEALCTFLELIFYEQIYPEMTDWWWYFRVNRFNPQGWVNSTIYEHSSFRSYVDAVYLRGALYLGDVRLLTGDQEFLEVLQKYFSAHQGGFTSSNDFFNTLPVDNKARLEDLFSVYFQAR